jgi:hypothetical protein
MSDFTQVVGNQDSAAAAAARTFASNAPRSLDTASLSPEGLLIFCQAQLGALDKSIQEKMKGQRGMLGVQSALADCRTAQCWNHGNHGQRRR